MASDDRNLPQFDTLAGKAAPPLVNGELMLDAPWQGRAFAMAQLLAQRGLFGWEEFRLALIARIAAAERDASPGQPFHYYDCVLEALHAVLATQAVVDDDAITNRMKQLENHSEKHTPLT
jgi:nitrile hydratase accessory protein